MLSERLSGERYGMDVPASVIYVVRETLIQEPPIRANHASLESLVSLPDDPTSITHQINQVAHTAAQPKTTVPAGEMWSWTPVAQLVLLTADGRQVPIHTSPQILAQMGLLTSQQRDTRPAGEVISPLDVGQVATLVARSREKEYQPQSAVYARQVGQLAAGRRDVLPAGEVIGDVRVSLAATITVQRADRPMPLTGAWAYQVTQQAVTVRTMPTPYSSVRAARLTLLSASKRQLDPPFTWAFVSKVIAMAAQGRQTEIPHSPIAAGQVLALTAQQRETGWHQSPLQVGQQHLQVAQERVVPPPDAMVGLMASTATSQATQGRSTPPAGAVRSPIRVGRAVLTFSLGRDMPHPDDVIDPSVGAHFSKLVGLAVQHRVTEPPTDTGGPSARVHSMALAPVLQDTEFPEPPTEPTDLSLALVNLLAQVAVLPDRDFPPQSRVYLPALAQSVLLGDAEGWADPTVPVSDAALHGQVQFVVLGDESLPPTTEVLSDAQLHQVARAVALDDSTGWMDPTIPNSLVRVRQVAELPVLGDTTLPPGDWPLSIAHVTQVASSAAVKDPSISGHLQGSDAGIYVLAEQVVMRDTTMLRLPPRPAGARPVITISIT